MSKKICFPLGLLALSSAFLYADDPVIAQTDEEAPPPPPAVVEQELRDAEQEYLAAKRMFNPWYTGPLVTPAPNVVPPGYVNIQPYVYVAKNYGKYDESGHSHDTPNFNQIKFLNIFQFGVCKNLDNILTLQGLHNSTGDQSYTNWADTQYSVEFQALTQTAYHPYIMLSVAEIFPSGSYQKLNPKKLGTDATGMGSYQTAFNFNIGKVVWWWTTHPMNIRFGANFTIPRRTHVKGLNNYGGGTGTNGTVFPGNNFSLDFGYEYSFTQRWVVALDLVYVYAFKTRFTGHHGTDPLTGLPNPVGGPFNDQFSIAPALEYNVTEAFGMLAGGWITLWGRNSATFAQGVFSFYYYF